MHLKFIFGKEYEISPYYIGPLVYEDGSGPVEFHTPKMYSIAEAIGWEKLFYNIYGSSLYEFVDEGNGEQKGNHFHVGIIPQDDKTLYRLYLSMYAMACSKADSINIGHYESSYRDTLDEWAYPHVRTFNSFRTIDGRSYHYLTPTTYRGRSLHLEIRASQGSITTDFLFFALSYYLFLKISKTNDQLFDLVYGYYRHNYPSCLNNYNIINELLGTSITNEKDLFEKLNPRKEKDLKDSHVITGTFHDDLYTLFKVGYRYADCLYNEGLSYYHKDVFNLFDYHVPGEKIFQFVSPLTGTAEGDYYERFR